MLEINPSGKKGATAISKGKLPALGIPRPGPMERYIRTVNTIAKIGCTFLIIHEAHLILILLLPQG